MSHPSSLPGEPQWYTFEESGFRYSFDLRFAAYHYAKRFTEGKWDEDGPARDDYDFALDFKGRVALDHMFGNMDPDDFKDAPQYVKVERIEYPAIDLSKLRWK